MNILLISHNHHLNSCWSSSSKGKWKDLSCCTPLKCSPSQPTCVYIHNLQKQVMWHIQTFKSNVVCFPVMHTFGRHANIYKTLKLSWYTEESKACKRIFYALGASVNFYTRFLSRGYPWSRRRAAFKMLLPIFPFLSYEITNKVRLHLIFKWDGSGSTTYRTAQWVCVVVPVTKRDEKQMIFNLVSTMLVVPCSIHSTN